MTGDGDGSPPFDIGFSFDAHLHEVPNDVAAMGSGRLARGTCTRVDGAARRRARTRHGGALARMLGEFARAQDCSRPR